MSLLINLQHPCCIKETFLTTNVQTVYVNLDNMTKCWFLSFTKEFDCDWVDQLSIWMDQCDPAPCKTLTSELHYLGSQASDFTVKDTPIQKVPVYFKSIFQSTSWVKSTAPEIV